MDGDITLPKETFACKEKNSTKEIEYLLNNINEENICKYPAKYSFLDEKLDLNISFNHCNDLNNFMKDSMGESASIVFVSSFLSSPSSFFGHVFLKSNKKDNIFFSQTISYAAEVPEDTGFFKMIYSGVGGDFLGTLNVTPYFKLLENYNVMEQRNIEEYQLNLTKKEVKRMLLHTYELLLEKDHYKFFENNCATELLWLINVAKPDANIMKDKAFFDTPYGVVKTAHKLGLLKNEMMTRDSMLSNMNELYFSMSQEEKEVFKEYKDSRSKKDLVVSEKVILLTNYYYDFMFKKYAVVFEDYNDVKELSSIIKHEKNTKKEIVTRNESKIEINSNYISFTPALLNKEYDYNEISEITLEFFKTSIDYDGKLEIFNIFDIQSNNLFLPYKKNASWKLYSGLKRDNEDNLIFSFDLMGGITIGNDILKAYSLLGVNLNTSKDIADIQNISGISYWIDQKIHLDYIFSKGVFENKFDKNEASLIYILHNHVFKMTYDNKKEKLDIGYIFKF